MKPYAFAAALAVGALAGCSSSSSGSRGSTQAPVTSNTPSAPASAQRQAPANLHTGPEAVLDATGAGAFFAAPFPADARRSASGSAVFSGLANPRQLWFVDHVYALADETPAFSPSGTVYLPFDAPVNAPAADPLAGLDPASPIVLVNIDPASPNRLTRHPFHAGLTAQADAYRPANLLQLQPVPGLPLDTNTTYAAIVLRGLGAPGAQWLGQSPALEALLAGKEPPGSQGIAWAQAFAPLRQALLDLQIHPDDIAAATVFTTHDPAARLKRMVDHVGSQPAPAIVGPLTVRDLYPGFTALRGSLAVDMYQRGVAPFPVAPGGRMVVDAAGLPVPQFTQLAEFQLSIPKGAMPASGFPLYFYVHGTGGLPSQAIDRGRFSAPNTPSPAGAGWAAEVAPEGWATSCLAGHLSPTRVGFLSAGGYVNYNFLNATAMRDNFAQMVLEQVAFLRALERLRIDAALCPGTDASASPDGKVFFDPQLRVVGGQSLGSYLSGMLAGLVDGWQGAVLTGAGGSWTEFALGPKDPVDLQLALQTVLMPPGDVLDRFHPVIMAFDLTVGSADNMHSVRHVLRDPYPGHTPPHVLVVEGDSDAQVPIGLQRALVLALGADLAGADPGPTAAEQLVPALPWGGLQQLAFPASANVLTGSGHTRTAVVVRYPEDPIRDGHYVWFQYDEARRRTRDFLSALRQGSAPVIQ
ncbi:MAG: hypothetical protein KDD82_31320 [Planctomycetes bacterium]|nr:hypothetical protein [Planctomycetota bacterium]